ncbi:Wzz/FepE/Etk N-terminal domain-containing protein [Halomonas alkaliantarctica]|uniref:Wzz/FepE/Etk N-terminal domain-containing protein n=1 Tax=Halomonas alkaliantarctica TaxID=232346 RepID=UPI0004A9F058|nr:Wzz/FepE/Etk N-terminal domain-containing protein [Halomonas alkaliantarctica]
MDNKGSNKAYEITLVDFVVLLLRQWKVMLSCIAIVLLITLLVAFLKPVQYEFTTMYGVASYETVEGAKRGLETPEEVVAKVNNIFLEQQRRNILSDSSIAELPFEVSVNNPRNTLLLKIASAAEEKYQPLIERFHESLVLAIEDDQRNLVNMLKNNLQYQFEAYSEALEAARASSSETAGEIEAAYFEKVFLLERRIDSINEGEASQLAVQSLEPVGLGKGFIVAVGFLLALLFAPIAAVISIFAKKVRIAYQHGD